MEHFGCMKVVRPHNADGRADCGMPRPVSHAMQSCCGFSISPLRRHTALLVKFQAQMQHIVPVSLHLKPPMATTCSLCPRDVAYAYARSPVQPHGGGGDGRVVVVSC